MTTRIDDDVAVPFMNRRNGVRVDRVDVHDALSEAVANALVLPITMENVGLSL